MKLSEAEVAQLLQDAVRLGHAIDARFVCELEDVDDLVTFSALAAEGDAELAEGAAKRRSMEILLYTGKPIARYGTKMVFDLGGMSIPKRQVPVLFAHDPERPIGYSAERPSTERGLRVKAAMLDNADSRFVAEQADQGLKWQASMGVRLTEVRYLDADEVREVNGEDFKGPGYVVTKSALLEASVLTLGADSDTQSIVMRLHDGGDRMTQPPRSPEMKANLKEFLAAFPQERRGWAAERFAELAEGKSTPEAIAAVKAELADELLKERGAVDEKLKEAEERLAVLGQEGAKTGDTPAFSGADAGDTGKVDLEAYDKDMLTDMGREQLKELLKPEWNKLKPLEQSAFGDFDNYAAYRRQSTLGRVRIQMGPPVVS